MGGKKRDWRVKDRVYDIIETAEQAGIDKETVKTLMDAADDTDSFDALVQDRIKRMEGRHHDQQSNGEGAAGTSTPGTVLSPTARRLLRDVAEHPFKPVTDRYNLFDHNLTGYEAKEELKQTGLAIERHIRPQAVKRTLLQLTPNARQYVQDHGWSLHRQGRGGIVHQFWQHQIKQIFEEAGWTAEIEKDHIDVQVRNGKHTYAIEVAMGDAPRELRHIQEMIADVDQVWVACRNSEIQAGLQERAAQNDLNSEQLQFKVFSAFTSTQVVPF